MADHHPKSEVDKLYKVGRVQPHEIQVDKTSYVEGFSTPANVAKWAARASAHSGPKFAPGTGNKPSKRDE